MTDILIADNLATVTGIRHAFFTRVYGNPGLSRQEHRAEALQVRARMAQDLSVEAQNLLTCYQIHSAHVVTVTENWLPDQRPQADALVTNKRGLALGVLTADCVPVLFADMNSPVIGAAHAGWKGAISGILENTVAAMEALGAQKKTIHAALGPCIWQKSYEVGAEFPAPFLAEDTKHQRFFSPAFRSGHYMFDLAGYVRTRLLNIGIISVAASPADTCAEPERFFSHRYSTLRSEERQGNLMSALALI
jgi:YfiH family protein